MKKTVLCIAAAILLGSCRNEPADSPIPVGEPVAKVSAAADSVFKDIRLMGTNEIHSLIVLQNGKLIYERYAEAQSPEYLHILWSASKTFTATAIGFAVQDGLLTVDDKVTKFFSEEELPAVHSPELDSMSIKNLLTMSSGLDRDLLSETEAGVLEHPAKEALASGFKFFPGSRFNYNSMNSYLLSAIITKVTGITAEEYLDTKLFTPLGIRRHLWEKTAEGYNMGGWGLHITTRSFAKMGQFLLQRGMWNGVQLLQESWFDEALRVHIDSSSWTGTGYRNGYGYQIWQCRIPGVFRIDGAWAQYCFIMPEKNAVVAMNCHCNKPDTTIESVLSRIYPEL